jgi:hypothetical protein
MYMSQLKIKVMMQKDRFYEELEAGYLGRYNDKATNWMTEKCGFVSQ